MGKTMTHNREENVREKMIHTAWRYVRIGARERDVSYIISARAIFESFGIEKGITETEELIAEMMPQKAVTA